MFFASARAEYLPAEESRKQYQQQDRTLSPVLRLKSKFEKFTGNQSVESTKEILLNRESNESVKPKHYILREDSTHFHGFYSVHSKNSAQSESDFQKFGSSIGPENDYQTPAEMPKIKRRVAQNGGFLDGFMEDYKCYSYPQSFMTSRSLDLNILKSVPEHYYADKDFGALLNAQVKMLQPSNQLASEYRADFQSMRHPKRRIQGAKSQKKRQMNFETLVYPSYPENNVFNCLLKVQEATILKKHISQKTEDLELTDASTQANLATFSQIELSKNANYCLTNSLQNILSQAEQSDQHLDGFGLRQHSQRRFQEFSSLSESGPRLEDISADLNMMQQSKQTTSVNIFNPVFFNVEPESAEKNYNLPVFGTDLQASPKEEKSIGVELCPKNQGNKNDGITEEEFKEVKRRIENFESKHQQMSVLKSRILLILGDPETDLEQAIILRKTLKEVEIDLEKTDEMIRNLFKYIKAKIQPHIIKQAPVEYNENKLGFQGFSAENTPPVNETGSIARETVKSISSKEGSSYQTINQRIQNLIESDEVQPQQHSINRNILNLTGRVNLQFQNLDEKMSQFSKNYDKMALKLNSTKENALDTTNFSLESRAKTWKKTGLVLQELSTNIQGPYQDQGRNTSIQRKKYSQLTPAQRLRNTSTSTAIDRSLSNDTAIMSSKYAKTIPKVTLLRKPEYVKIDLANLIKKNTKLPYRDTASNSIKSRDTSILSKRSTSRQKTNASRNTNLNVLNQYAEQIVENAYGITRGTLNRQSAKAKTLAQLESSGSTLVLP